MRTMLLVSLLVLGATACLKRAKQDATPEFLGIQNNGQSYCAKVDLSSQFPDAAFRDQMDAGSCHSFASVGLVEAALKRQYGIKVRLSEAHLFVERVVTTPDFYEVAKIQAFKNRPMAVVKEGWRSDHKFDAKEFMVTEGLYPDKDIQYVFEHGIATAKTADYKTFLKKYQEHRAKEQKEFKSTIESATNIRHHENEYMNWYFSIAQLAFYQASTDWIQHQTKPETRELTLKSLLGGPDNYKRIQEEQKVVRDALAGFKLVKEDFVPDVPNYRLKPGTSECKLLANRVKTWLTNEMCLGRPLAVAVDLQDLKAWGQTEDSRDRMHAFVLTGFRSQEGKVYFQTRNSWGGHNPEVSEDELCRVLSAYSIHTPNDPPDGSGRPSTPSADLVRLSQN